MSRRVLNPGGNLPHASRCRPSVGPNASCCRVLLEYIAPIKKTPGGSPPTSAADPVSTRDKTGWSYEHQEVSVTMRRVCGAQCVCPWFAENERAEVLKLVSRTNRNSQDCNCTQCSSAHWRHTPSGKHTPRLPRHRLCQRTDYVPRACSVLLQIV
jgi:hypothetical protein